MEGIRKNYGLIDITKVLMAVLVIVLHTSPFMDVSKAIEWASRCCITIIAVPFFFTATGFFASKNGDSIKKSIMHLLSLYVIWSIIYLPYAILKLDCTGLKGVVEYIWSFVAYGSYDTIWYLHASAIALIIYSFLYKRIGLKYTFIVSIVCYAVGLMGTAYAGLFCETPVDSIFLNYLSVFHTFKNGLFFGFVFVSLGAIIREISINKDYNWWMFSAIFFALTIAESVGIKVAGIDSNGVDMKIMPVPFSYCIMRALLQSKSSIQDKKTGFLRKLSTLMFLSQRIFIRGYEIIGINDMVNSVIWFFLILLSTVLFSVLFIMASQKIEILRKCC